MAKPTELMEVKKQMSEDCITAPLVEAYHRIKVGDLQESMAVMVIIIDPYGLASHIAHDDRDAFFMSTVISNKLSRTFEVDDDDE